LEHTLYKTQILGKTASTASTVNIDSSTYRFNQLATGNWFRNTIVVPALGGAASTVEIEDVQYVVATPGGKNAESALQ
jgi:hypothetical protein